MELVTESAVHRYLADDVIGSLMDVCSGAGDEDLTCQKWLRGSVAKRLVFDRLYGDLLRETEGRRVLDIGGGLTCLTRMLVNRHDYRLVDLMAHDGARAVERAQALADRLVIDIMDWYEFAPDGSYDVVVANDLFPNVDQRLELFFEKFLPVAREVRLSLTFYPKARFYKTRRVEGDEILCMLAWDGEATARILKKYADHIVAPNLRLLTAENTSVYPNGRQICLACLKGDRT